MFYHQANLEKVTMAILKIVDPRIDRQQIGNIRRWDLRNTNHEKKDEKYVFKLILIKFKSREVKVNIMKEKKKFPNANLNVISNEKVYINENLTYASRNLLFHARRFQRYNGWRFVISSQGTILLKEKREQSSYCNKFNRRHRKTSK